jgi:hypothetical protein
MHIAGANTSLRQHTPAALHVAQTTSKASHVLGLMRIDVRYVDAFLGEDVVGGCSCIQISFTQRSAIASARSEIILLICSDHNHRIRV